MLAAPEQFAVEYERGNTEHAARLGLRTDTVVQGAALAAGPAELSKPEPAKPDEPDEEIEEDGFASILGGLGLTPDEK